MEEKMLRAVNAVRQMRDKEALQSDTQANYLYGDDQIHNVRSSGSLQSIQRPDIPMSKRVAVGARRFYDNLVYGENVPLEGDEPPNVEIEKAVRVSFLDYHESLTAWRASQFARTPLGVMASIFGYALLIGCVVRVYMAINNIISSGSARRSNPSEQIHKIITTLGIDADVQVVSQYITFLFTSTLLSVNIRAALRRITLVFSLVSTNSTLSSSVGTQEPLFDTHTVYTEDVLANMAHLRPGMFAGGDFLGAASWSLFLVHDCYHPFPFALGL
mmetsp:Transcript_10201/g.14756  ORF Transcript_10201/g.14756 Transcript_10201/m.14756 type:complete len:273 (-) Transcript_10201:185-1003(-)